jgi:hypothetical protein
MSHSIITLATIERAKLKPNLTVSVTNVTFINTLAIIERANLKLT